ncbi:MAG TPA: ATP synthase subunit I [Mariprofundaceae bacterium]|nr:ATP synthase subunit I [Mariprofundaceae bacterium]
MNETPQISEDSREQADGSYEVSGFLARQLIAGGCVAVGFALFVHLEIGLAVLFGVVLMVVNAAWLNRRMMATEGLDVEAGQRNLYSGAALRFGGLLLGLLVAGVMGLHLLYVALGMFVAQAVIFFTALRGFGKE